MNRRDIPDGYLTAIDAFAATLRPAPRMTVSEWADAERMLPSKGAAEPGRWRTARTPYLRAIMDALSPHHAAQRIIFMASAQVGKTEAGLNWAGYVMATQAAPMLAVQPTVDTGELWSKQRLQSMIDATPNLRTRVMPQRSRDSGNTTRLKEFPGGMLRIGGANSSADLASMPIRYLFLDEVDRYPLDLDDEGDPVSIAEARTTTFVRRKILLTSTPTIESLSRINKEWLASSQQRYHVVCPHCGERQHLQWDNLRWPEGRPHAAQYVCEHCGAFIAETHKAAMLAGGEWVAAFPDRPALGFHLNALYTPPGLGLTWGELATEFEAKKREPLQLKVFQNVRLGECSADPEEKLDWEDLKSRAEPFALRIAPPGCLVATAGVDVQKDRLAVQIRGWGRASVCWTLDWVELPGDPTHLAVWDDLERLLSEPLLNAHGTPLRISRAAIDAGYLTDDVLAFTRKYERRGWFAIKGVSGARQIISRPSKVDLRRNGVTQKGGASLWPVGVDAAKEWIFARLGADGKHAMASDRQERFSADLPEEYFAQLASEVYDPNKRRWIKQRARNEALDTAVYARAAAMHPALRLHVWSDAKWSELARLLEPAIGDLFSPPATEAPVSTQPTWQPGRPQAAPAPDTAPQTKAVSLVSRLA
ncbi:MAG: phage terminase large subunit family protein [Burkholderiales bacterium]|nr:phage terminase large subunit family protein [Burkholderiales bacterium]